VSTHAIVFLPTLRRANSACTVKRGLRNEHRTRLRDRGGQHQIFSLPLFLNRARKNQQVAAGFERKFKFGKNVKLVVKSYVAFATQTAWPGLVCCQNGPAAKGCSVDAIAVAIIVSTGEVIHGHLFEARRLENRHSIPFKTTA
jgi:hypothetical protein